MPFAAVIHDLPGIGGIREPYQSLVSHAIGESDCILYVTNAQKELRDSELRLIAEIERIFANPSHKKSVFFVLSGFDMVRNGQEVLSKNNQILKEHFSNQEFVGGGFIAVSPSKEARAETLYQKKEFSKEKRDLNIANSQMNDLRQKLIDYLSTQSGPVRLRKVLGQMTTILKNIQQHIAEIEKSETKPLQEADRKLQEIDDQERRLISNRITLAENLDKLDKRTVENSLHLDPDKLKKLLGKKFDSCIRHQNVAKVSVQIQFNQELDTAWADWLEQNAVKEELRKSIEAYDIQMIKLVESYLGILARADQGIEPNGIIDDILNDVPDARFQSVGSHSKITLKENLDTAAKAIGLMGLSSGSTITALTALGFSSVTMTTGIPVFAGGILVLGISVWRYVSRKRQNKEEIQTQMRQYLSDFADIQYKHLTDQVRECIKLRRAAAELVIDREINKLNDESKVLSERKRSGDLKVC